MRPRVDDWFIGGEKGRSVSGWLARGEGAGGKSRELRRVAAACRPRRRRERRRAPPPVPGIRAPPPASLLHATPSDNTSISARAAKHCPFFYIARRFPERGHTARPRTQRERRRARAPHAPENKQTNAAFFLFTCGLAERCIFCMPTKWTITVVAMGRGCECEVRVSWGLGRRRGRWRGGRCSRVHDAKKKVQSIAAH